VVVDLVKQVEKKAREMLIGEQFRQAVQVVNEYIDSDKKIRYCALDFSKTSKSQPSSSSGATSAASEQQPSTANVVEGGATVKRRLSRGISGPEWAAFELNLSHP